MRQEDKINLRIRKMREAIIMDKKEYFMGLGIAGTGVLLVVVIFAAISVLSFLNGGTGFALTCVDQSRQQLSNCNTDCGEGILSEFCKSKCTSENSERIDKCKEKIF